MAETMKLQVITLDKEFFHGDVSMVERIPQTASWAFTPSISR